MDILVTGGAGYVGSVLVPLLLAQGHSVRVLDVLRYGGQSLLPWCGHPHLDIIQGDVSNQATAQLALQGMDAIVHLAGLVGAPACALEPALASSANVDGTRSLLATRRRDQALILASTGSVYGHVTADAC